MPLKRVSLVDGSPGRGVAHADPTAASGVGA